MSQPAANLRVRISADLADIKQGLGLLRGELAKVKTQAATALPSNNAFVSGIKRARAELASFVGIYLSLRGVSVLGGIADEATQIRGRVRAAKGDYEALLALANETRTGLNSTVDLYARMERGTRSMGVSQEKLLSLTKSVNQAIRLSFTSTAAGEAAVMQFGQALAAGQLRGDELNSVLEQTPRLAEAVAAGMGLQVGALKALAKEGKLTAEEVLKAVLTQAAALDKEFKAMPQTIGDAMTLVRNSFVDYIGDQDEATGASRRFAEALAGIAKDLPKYLDPLLKAVTLLIENFDVLATFFITRMAAAAIPAMVNGFVALRTAILAARTATLTLSGALALLGGPVGIALAALAAAVYLLYKRTTAAKAAADAHNEALAESNRLSQLGAGYAKTFAQEKAREAAATLKAAQAKLVDAQAYAASIAARTPTTGSGEAVWAQQFASGAAEGRVTQAQAAIGQAQKMLQDWQRELVKVALSASDEVLDSASTAATGATTVVGDAADKAKEKLNKLRDEAERLLKESEASAQKITDKLMARDERIDTGLEEARLAQLVATGNGLEAAFAQIDAKWASLMADLRATGNTTGIELVTKVINLEKLDAQLEAFRAKADKVLGSLRTTETSLAGQSAGGLISPAAAERELSAVRSKALTQLGDLRTAVAAYYEKTQDPAVLAYLQELTGSLGEVAAAQSDFTRQAKDVALDGLNGFFDDLRANVESTREAFESLIESVLLGIAKILQQKTTEAAVDALFNFFDQSKAGKHHNGGIAGSGGTAVRVNPLWFGAAPRYHSGGFAGLKSDEVAAVLQRGEEVLPKDDPRHTRNGGRKGGANVVVNVENNSGAPAETRESTAPNGDRLIEVIIGAVDRRIAGGGSTAKAIGSRFGLNPVGVVRG